MRKRTLYFDTSVPSAYYNEERPIRQRITKAWWKNDLKEFNVFISDVTLEELEETRDKNRKANLWRLIADLPVLERTAESTALAEKYLRAKILPVSCFRDLNHIAIATVYVDVDVLVSWNFEDLVRLETKDKVNGVNIFNGYRPIQIESPYALGGEKYERKISK